MIGCCKMKINIGYDTFNGSVAYLKCIVLIILFQHQFLERWFRF